MAQFKFESIYKKDSEVFECNNVVEFMETLILLADTCKESVYAYMPGDYFNCGHAHYCLGKVQAVEVKTAIRF